VVHLRGRAGALAVVGDALPAPVGDLLFAVPVVFLPVATGTAILRYRLYEIDRLINRTLVYGLLTALLGGVYGGAVLVLGQVFGGVGRDPPSWAVAGATLAAAALFQPARRRIQAAVDRSWSLATQLGNSDSLTWCTTAGSQESRRSPVPSPKRG
jgi:hypothetical protein